MASIQAIYVSLNDILLCIQFFFLLPLIVFDHGCLLDELSSNSSELSRVLMVSALFFLVFFCFFLPPLSIFLLLLPPPLVIGFLPSCLSIAFLPIPLMFYPPVLSTYFSHAHTHIVRSSFYVLHAFLDG